MPAPRDQDGKLPGDSNNQAIQMPKSYTQFDGTIPTAEQSPINVGAVVETLIPPVLDGPNTKIYATNVIITPEDDAVRFSKAGDLLGTAGNPYERVPPNVPRSIPLKKGEVVLLLRHVGDVNVSVGWQYL